MRPPQPSNDDLARIADGVDLEHVLGQVEANGGNLQGGWLPGSGLRDSNHFGPLRSGAGAIHPICYGANSSITIRPETVRAPACEPVQAQLGRAGLIGYSGACPSSPCPATVACCSCCPAPRAPARPRCRAAWVSDHSDLNLSISVTTRAPRPGEKDGREYHFVDRKTFDAMAGRGEFLEWAEVHDHCYGSPKGADHEVAGRGAGRAVRHRLAGRPQHRRRRARGHGEGLHPAAVHGPTFGGASTPGPRTRPR